MSDRTRIGWTDATWNPWHGCHQLSEGCDNCYMFTAKRRYGQDPDLVVRSKTTFRDPLKWKNPRRVFTCSWSDFFIREADPWRDECLKESTVYDLLGVLRLERDIRGTANISERPHPTILSECLAAPEDRRVEAGHGAAAAPCPRCKQWQAAR